MKKLAGVGIIATIGALGGLIWALSGGSSPTLAPSNPQEATVSLAHDEGSSTSHATTAPDTGEDKPKPASPDASKDWSDEIARALSREDDAALLRIFDRASELSSADKGELLGAAVLSADRRVQNRAHLLLRQMVQEGSVSDALAAMIKASYLPGSMQRDLVRMQASLCRFGGSPNIDEREELGFEMIKMKFDSALGKEKGAQPWQVVCTNS